MAGARGSVFSRELVLAAIRDSFPKLDPRSQVRNPVMFIVELGSVITTGIFFLNLFRGDRRAASGSSPRSRSGSG